MEVSNQAESSVPAGMSLLRLFLVTFLVASGLNLLWLGSGPLADSTEARHAEIGREFAEGGHWLVPTLNYRPYLTKPPLTDWLVAVGIKMFGADEFGARFASAIVAALGIALLAVFGCRLGGRQTGLAAAVLYFVCPLYLGLSRSISIDIVLATLAVGAYWAAWEVSREDCVHPRRAALAWSISLGLGVLAKGHIMLLLVLAPVVIWIVWRKRWHAVRRLTWAPAVLLFLAIALPWFLYTERRFPNWVFVMMGHELEEERRITEFGASWYGLAVLFFLGGALPTLPLAFLSFMNRSEASPMKRRNEGIQTLLRLWVFVPLAVFGFWTQQRVNYVAPMLPAAALVAGMGWDRLAAQWPAASRRQRSAAYLTAGIPLLLGAAFVIAYIVLLSGTEKPSIGALSLEIVGFLALLALSVAGIMQLSHACLTGAMRLFLASALLVGGLALPLLTLGKAQRSAWLTGKWVGENLPPESEVVLYSLHSPSCNFYSRRYLEIFKHKVRGIEWDDFWPFSRSLPTIESWDEANRRAKTAGGIWFVLKPNRIKNLEDFTYTEHLRLDVKQFDDGLVLAHLSESSSPAK